MTELLVTPKSLNHMKTLIELGADAFVIGEQNLDYDYPENLIVKMFEKAVNLAHEHDKKYMWQLMVFFNYHLNALENYIEFYMK